MTEMTHHLVGVSEIAAMLGVSRQRADQIVGQKGFPDPVVVLASGRIWQTSAVSTWIEATRGHSPAAVVKVELDQLQLDGAKQAPSIFKMVYAVVRQQGLGRNRLGVPATRRFACERALEEARRCDPGFSLDMPEGWLEETD